MKNKIIIHTEDIDIENAMDMVWHVMQQGKISASGRSYCYLTRMINGFVVSTDKPRRGTKTYVFYVFKEKKVSK